MADKQEWTVGRQRIWFEAPDTLWARFTGDLTLEETHGVIDGYREAFTANGPFFLAATVKGAGIDAKCRKYLTENIPSSWLLGTVYIGAGIIQKAMSKTITLALLFSGNQQLPMGFAETEEQARQWIVEERAKRAAEATAKAAGT